MLVSPAEHADELRILGEYSSECEKLGADFLIFGPTGITGIQRKAVPDLVSSMRDGRLQRELIQMETLDNALLIVEGRWEWDHQGISKRTGLSISEYRGVMLSLQIEHGLPVLLTSSVSETAEVLRHMEVWFSKAEHGSLLRVPKAKVPPQIHILQHFPGIGLTRAKKIYEFFGRVPLRWDCTEAEMALVPGIGKPTVKKLWDILR